MRFAFRLIALALILFAAVVAVADVRRAAADGDWTVSPLGKVWFELDPASLNMLQAGIQRRVAPWLWEDVMQPVLIWPAAPVLALAGMALLLATRRRRDHV